MKVPPNSQADDDWIVSQIPLVSQRIENMTRLRFVPWKELYYYDAFGAHIDDVYRKLDLGRPLLAPVTVIDALQNTLTLGTDFVIVPQDTPAFQLQRINTIFGWSYGIGYGIGFWLAPIQFQRAIQVTGIWGYRQNYPIEGWTDSLQVVTNVSGMDASQTTFTVANVGGTDAYGRTPALSPGNTIQIDTEWMQVLAVNTNTNTVTVLRGINTPGFTSTATHAQNAKVYTWSVQPEIARAAARWIGYWYDRRGAYDQVKSDLAVGRVSIYPEDAPAEVMHIIEQTRDWRFTAV